MSDIDTLRLALCILSGIICAGMLSCAFILRNTRQFGCYLAAGYAFFIALNNGQNLSAPATVGTYGLMAVSISGIVYIVRVYDERKRGKP